MQSTLDNDDAGKEDENVTPKDEVNYAWQPPGESFLCHLFPVSVWTFISEAVSQAERLSLVTTSADVFSL